jgi:hypothetical protein
VDNCLGRKDVHSMNEMIRRFTGFGGEGRDLHCMRGAVACAVVLAVAALAGGGCSSSVSGLQGYEARTAAMKYGNSSPHRTDSQTNAPQPTAAPETDSQNSPSTSESGLTDTHALDSTGASTPPSTHQATGVSGAVKSAAEKELGPKAVESLTVVESPPPAPRDPGADRLVKSMLASIPDRQMGDDGVTHVGTSQIRNQSRCGHDEFDAFRVRLAKLLSESGRDEHLAFTTDDSATEQYEMQGTAYLITADGFDQWELFLSITPASKSLTVWEAGSAVHVLRDPRAGAPQVFFPKH